MKNPLFIFLAVLTCFFSVLTGCSPQPTSTVKRGIESKFFYTQNSDGSPGYTIIFSLSNYTSQPLTAVKAEVIDGAGNIKRSFDESYLHKTSAGGVIVTEASLNLSYKTPDLPPDIKKWTTRWQYLDSKGVLSTISGNYFDRK